MPDESGPQLAEDLVGRCPGLPVLFISGFTGDELQRQGAIGPGIAFLQKPYTPRELGERVRAVLDESREPLLAGGGENPAVVRS
jgi:FixJ family two-component response regulator